MNILHIESSIFTNDGVSSQLSRALIEQLTQSNHHSQVKSRQLGAESIPHFDSQVITALSTAPEHRSEQQQALVNFADQQIEAVQWADILVLGMPMYNFGVP
ncbi:MAG: NAD(P)H-dependent oxidoreductase, partial [Gammaproteobacteria bacterium]|nr:NAD(P)H-dependent oxidoreductase [Gammaproteobacteria bacterium]